MPPPAPARPPAQPPDRPNRGQYEGVYRVDGFSLVRDDGRRLVVCYETRRGGPTTSDRFLVDATHPKRVRIGYLYGPGPDLADRQFDDRVWRYVVVRLDRQRVHIRSLYPVKNRKRGASK